MRRFLNIRTSILHAKNTYNGLCALLPYGFGDLGRGLLANIRGEASL